MKITLIIVIVLMVIVGAGSGYFIATLNGNIDSLRTELANNYGVLGAKIDQAGTRLESEIKSGDEALTASILANQSSLQQFADATNQKISGIQNDVQAGADKINTVTGEVNGFSAQISGLGNRVQDAENAINENILQTASFYKDAKKAIVRITNGQDLSGSGFIMVGNPGAPISGTNKIVTAYHVIADMANIYVTLDDGRSWRARVWAGSAAADVAILLFTEDTADLPDMASLPALRLGDSTAVNPGDPCFVIGSPGGDSSSALGLDGTITSGIISQVHRAEVVGNNYMTNLIQIDAPVNFGNSGGPLFNSRGEVIGIINSRIDPNAGDGISFAVSSSMVKRVEKIITNTSGVFTFNYPLLGISMRDLDPADIAEGNNAITLGAKVTNVTGPALAAGVRVNDIITAINGNQVRNSGELSSWVGENTTPGDRVNLTIVRGNISMEVTVTVGVKP